MTTSTAGASASCSSSDYFVPAKSRKMLARPLFRRFSGKAASALVAAGGPSVFLLPVAVVEVAGLGEVENAAAPAPGQDELHVAAAHRGTPSPPAVLVKSGIVVDNGENNSNAKPDSLIAGATFSTETSAVVAAPPPMQPQQQERKFLSPRPGAKRHWLLQQASGWFSSFFQTGATTTSSGKTDEKVADPSPAPAPDEDRAVLGDVAKPSSTVENPAPQGPDPAGQHVATSSTSPLIPGEDVGAGTAAPSTSFLLETEKTTPKAEAGAAGTTVGDGRSESFNSESQSSSKSGDVEDAGRDVAPQVSGGASDTSEGSHFSEQQQDHSNSATTASASPSIPASTSATDFLEKQTDPLGGPSVPTRQIDEQTSDPTTTSTTSEPAEDVNANTDTAKTSFALTEPAAQGKTTESDGSSSLLHKKNVDPRVASKAATEGDGSDETGHAKKGSDLFPAPVEDADPPHDHNDFKPTTESESSRPVGDERVPPVPAANAAADAASFAESASLPGSSSPSSAGGVTAAPDQHVHGAHTEGAARQRVEKLHEEEAAVLDDHHHAAGALNRKLPVAEVDGPLNHEHGNGCAAEDCEEDRSDIAGAAGAAGFSTLESWPAALPPMGARPPPVLQRSMSASAGGLVLHGYPAAFQPLDPRSAPPRTMSPVSMPVQLPTSDGSQRQLVRASTTALPGYPPAYGSHPSGSSNSGPNVPRQFVQGRASAPAAVMGHLPLAMMAPAPRGVASWHAGDRGSGQAKWFTQALFDSASVGKKQGEYELYTVMKQKTKDTLRSMEKKGPKTFEKITAEAAKGPVGLPPGVAGKEARLNFWDTKLDSVLVEGQLSQLQVSQLQGYKNANAKTVADFEGQYIYYPGLNMQTAGSKIYSTLGKRLGAGTFGAAYELKNQKQDGTRQRQVVKMIACPHFVDALPEHLQKQAPQPHVCGDEAFTEIVFNLVLTAAVPDSVAHVHRVMVSQYVDDQHLAALQNAKVVSPGQLTPTHTVFGFFVEELEIAVELKGKESQDEEQRRSKQIEGALSVAGDLAKNLYAHFFDDFFPLGFVHNDIKLSNMGFVISSGHPTYRQVKLFDFGLSSFVAVEDDKMPVMFGIDLSRDIAGTAVFFNPVLRYRADGHDFRSTPLHDYTPQFGPPFDLYAAARTLAELFGEPEALRNNFGSSLLIAKENLGDEMFYTNYISDPIELSSKGLPYLAASKLLKTTRGKDAPQPKYIAKRADTDESPRSGKPLRVPGSKWGRVFSAGDYTIPKNDPKIQSIYLKNPGAVSRLRGVVSNSQPVQLLARTFMTGSGAGFSGSLGPSASSGSSSSRSSAPGASLRTVFGGASRRSDSSVVGPIPISSGTQTPGSSGSLVHPGSSLLPLPPAQLASRPRSVASQASPYAFSAPGQAQAGPTRSYSSLSASSGFSSTPQVSGGPFGPSVSGFPVVSSLPPGQGLQPTWGGSRSFLQDGGEPGAESEHQGDGPVAP
ncbi:unnamed protein product [Amoebophrya sp. A120]|nr:unnamed protein product [Amoebophrya sp. A120]|eukprot:GSA120T00008787001.1